MTQAHARTRTHTHTGAYFIRLKMIGRHQRQVARLWLLPQRVARTAHYEGCVCAEYIENAYKIEPTARVATTTVRYPCPCIIYVKTFHIIVLQIYTVLYLK